MASAAAGFAPETALDFARVINMCRESFGDAKAYAFSNAQSHIRKMKHKLLAKGGSQI